MNRHHATFAGNVPFTAEEKAAHDAQLAAAKLNPYDPKEDQVRTARNQMLQASDWMGCSDVTMTDDWKVYRQLLRDIPEQPGFPEEFVDDSGFVTLPPSPQD